MIRASRLRIKPMTREDFAACRKIVSCSEPWMTLHESVDFSRAMAKGQAYVGIKDNQVAGFVIFDPQPVFARGGYLRAIAVASHYRGSGIGSELLSFAETRTARHASYFYLCVSSFNTVARTFYKRLGYKKAGRIPNLIVKGKSEDIFWKRLRS